MTITQIIVKLTYHSDDFCLVYVSGHGSEGVRGVPTVCLNDSDKKVPVQGLYPLGKYGVVITDCCRGNGQETLNESVRNENFAIRTASDVNETSRNLWSRMLETCIEDNKNQGIVEMLSCGYNEAARETIFPNAHGYYSYALLQAAKDWHANVESNSSLTTWDIHIIIYDYIVRQGQHPSYAPENLKYPFAVKA